MGKGQQKDIKIFEDFQAAEEKIEQKGDGLLELAGCEELEIDRLLEQSIDLSEYNERVKDLSAMRELLGRALKLRLLDVVDTLFGKRYSIGFVQRYMEHKYKVSTAIANSLIKTWVRQQEVFGAQDKKLKRVILEKKLESAMHEAMKRGLLKEELMAMALYAKVAGLNVPIDKDAVPDGYKDIKMVIPGIGEVSEQTSNQATVLQKEGV